MKTSFKKSLCKKRLLLEITVVGLILPTTQSHAVQCNSMAASALTPVTEDSSLSWSLEFDYKVGSVDYIGYNKDSEIFMALAVLEWEATENSRFFVEVGTKQWSRSGNSGDGSAFNIPGFGHLPYGDDDWREQRHTGLREAFWEYGNNELLARVGLQSMASRDGVLLDERVLGLFLDYELSSSVSLQVGAGTVDKDFSRMGKFCASRHSYRPLSGYYEDPVSDTLGESNLVYADFYWRPKSDMTPAESGNDPFSSDDFGEFDAFSGDISTSEAGPAEFFQLDGMGLNFFSQFGDAFDDDALFALAYTKFDLLEKLHLTAHLGTDLSSDESNFAAGVVADYSVLFEKAGSLAINLGYWHVQNADEDGRFYPAYSNLLLGEVSKIDMSHAPIAQVAVEYTLPTRWPVFAGINHVRKTEGEWLRETDFQIGFRPTLGWKIGNVELGKHMSVIGTKFTVDAETLDETLDGWRVEVRWAF